MERAPDAEGVTDTDILIDAQRGRQEAQDFLMSQRAATGLVLSVISAMELIVGCRNTRALAEVQRFLRYVRMLPLSMTASYTADDDVAIVHRWVRAKFRDTARPETTVRYQPLPLPARIRRGSMASWRASATSCSPITVRVRTKRAQSQTRSAIF